MKSILIDCYVTVLLRSSVGETFGPQNLGVFRPFHIPLIVSEDYLEKKSRIDICKIAVAEYKIHYGDIEPDCTFRVMLSEGVPLTYEWTLLDSQDDVTV